jgi:hypothetical protein
MPQWQSSFRTEIVENRLSAMQQGDSDEAATGETPTVSSWASGQYSRIKYRDLDDD